MSALSSRLTEHNIDPDILTRWSPRSFTDDTMSEKDLLAILEAARWAPSAFNAQPWHFVYARRSDADWDEFADLLAPFNKDWAQHSAALVFIASQTMRANSKGELSPSRSHAFDAGAAWGLLALQATKLGWRAHGMAGLDHDRAMERLGLPDGWRIEIAVAIGREGDGSSLTESLRAREVPSQRKPLAEIASQGRFQR
jgi:nitroreductase